VIIIEITEYKFDELKKDMCLLLNGLRLDRINLTKSHTPRHNRGKCLTSNANEKNSFFYSEQKIVFLQKKDYLTMLLKGKDCDPRIFTPAM
jgi:hypothetical protein